jgi:acetyltransferase-like isoleucine patch superfamily enzyme
VTKHAIAPTAVILQDVHLGDGATVGEFVLLGARPLGVGEGGPLVVGMNSTIRSHTVIYLGTSIGRRFQTGHGTTIRESNVIGSDVSIGTHSVVEHHVTMGDRVRIHSGTFIPEYSVLENDVWIGPHVVFTNALYPVSPSAKNSLRGPYLMAGAKIGANATLLPGVTIGRDALVGAGSVVVGDIEDGAVVVGNPARRIKWIRDISEYEGRNGY